MLQMVHTKPRQLRETGWSDPTELRLVKSALRRPGWIVATTTFCVAGALFYLAVATPHYTATARVRIDQNVASIPGSPDPVRTSEETLSFLNAEMAVLTSSPVIEIALRDERLAGSVTPPREPSAAMALREKLKTQIGRKDGLISVQYQSPSRETAVRVVGSVVDAYIGFQTRKRQEGSAKLLSILGEEKAKRETIMREKTGEMLKMLESAGTLSFEDKRSSDELISLRNSLWTAHSEAEIARAYHQEAMTPLTSSQTLLAQFEQRKGTDRSPNEPELDGKQLRLAIADLELRKQDLSRRYLPEYPQVSAVQAQLDKLRVLYAVSTYGRLLKAKQREENLAMAIHEQEALLRLLADKATQYMALTMELKQHERQLDLLEDRIIALNVRRDSAGLHTTVVEPAQASVRPTQPRRIPIISAAACLGLLLGALMAHSREVNSQSRPPTYRVASRTDHRLAHSTAELTQEPVASTHTFVSPSLRAYSRGKSWEQRLNPGEEAF